MPGSITQRRKIPTKTNRVIKELLFLTISCSLLFSTACAAQEDDLFEAIKNGDTAGVEALVQSGVDVNCVDETGQAPLHHACYLGHLNIVGILLENGASVNQKVSERLLTPLHGAAMNGDPELIAYLVDHGADVGAKDTEGTPPLMAACWVGSLQAVTVLVLKGARLDAETNYGSTPLHCASQSSNLALVRFLIKNGANINARSARGATPLHMAAARGNLSIVRELLRSGADPTVRLTRDSTPAFCLKAPILNDDDVMWINFSKGQSPLDIAMEGGHQEIIPLLK
jgi:ankyrin repeat protein